MRPPALRCASSLRNGATKRHRFQEPGESTVKRVLILCTGNSCRSQMAEGLWNDLGKGEWQAYSAGSNPAGYVHESAVQAMNERGLDISSNQSKNVSEFVDQPIDLVVTVCDNAKDSCPTLPVRKRCCIGRLRIRHTRREPTTKRCRCFVVFVTKYPIVLRCTWVMNRQVRPISTVLPRGLLGQ